MRNRRSREFELWATRIESTLVPSGARLKSPDRIRDKITGQYREVDASVRHKVGSCELLITIECRDRSRVQDVTWVEQLATKRSHIGADRTIAVSSTPFTAAAITAAAHHNISLRRIADLTADEILSLGGGIEVSIGSVAVTYGPLTITFLGEMPRQADLASRDLFLAHGWDARIFKRSNPDRLVSVNEFLGEDQRVHDASGLVKLTLPPKASMSLGEGPMWRHLQDVPLDGTPIKKVLTISFDPNELVTASTNDGDQRVIAIGAEFTATRTSAPVAPKRVSEYSDELQLLGRYTEHEFEFGGKSFKVLSHPVQDGAKK